MPRAASPQRGRELVNQPQNATPPGAQKGRVKVIGKELPDGDTEEQFRANWKISKAREESLLIEFHDQLASAGLLKPEHDKFYIRRFLRARQHDLGKAKQMFADHIKWRQEYEVDSIVHDFQFNEREAFLSLYPQGYHKTDKQGRPVYIQHLGAINIKKLNEITSEDRMLKFHIQEYERCIHYIMPACSRVYGHHIEQTFAIIDVTGVGLSHMSGQVKNLLSKITSIDQGNYPEMMGKTVIINAPSMFKLVWGVVKRFLDARTLSKIELHGSSYQSVLLKYIAEENLPEYLGGGSKATLLDDAGPWQDKDLIAEIDADYKAISDGLSVEADATTTADGRGQPSERQMSRAESRASRADSAGAPSEATEPAATTRAGSPKRKLSIRPFRRHHAAVAPKDGSPSDASEAFHDPLELQSRSASYASEDDAQYYSPRSTSSFSSMSERLQPRDAEESNLHPRLDALDSAKTQTPGQRKEMKLAARIRRLEEAVPGLREKLAPDLELKLESGSFSRRSGHNIIGRVDALEDAIEVLLTMQEEKVAAAHPAAAKEGKKEEEGTTCLCCSIM